MSGFYDIHKRSFQLCCRNITFIYKTQNPSGLRITPASREDLDVDGFFLRTCAHGLHSAPRPPGQTAARVFPLEAISRTAGEVTPGVHFKATRARVPAVWNKVEHTAAHLWNSRRTPWQQRPLTRLSSGVSEFARTAAEGRPGPAPALEAPDGALAQQFVSSVALHLTSGPQSAPVAAPARRVAGGLPVGQPHRVAPERICAPSISVSNSCHQMPDLCSDQSKLYYSYIILLTALYEEFNAGFIIVSVLL